MADLVIGKVRPLSIAFLDQSGKPMAVAPTLDGKPGWANLDTSVATLAVADDGMTATETGLKAGDDKVSMTVVVGGVAFTAMLDVHVAEPPQVLTAVAIIEGADQ